MCHLYFKLKGNKNPWYSLSICDSGNGNDADHLDDDAYRKFLEDATTIRLLLGSSQAKKDVDATMDHIGRLLGDCIRQFECARSSADRARDKIYFGETGSPLIKAHKACILWALRDTTVRAEISDSLEVPLANGALGPDNVELDESITELVPSDESAVESVSSVYQQ